MKFILDWLAHPLTKGLELDDPATTNLRRQIIKSKPFLKGIYTEWYCALVKASSAIDGPILELGAGAGFLSEVLPAVIRSDILTTNHIDLVCDAMQLPFPGHIFRGILMTNVLHHLSEPEQFFDEAARCVKTGGIIAMIEPWNTAWSKLVYTRIHHEPFDPTTNHWNLEPGKPLSNANGAIPWIIFSRDRATFECIFPELKIEAIELMMPFSYLLSGGVSMRNLIPGWVYRPWRDIEKLLQPIINSTGMFALITLRKTN
ncbi:MAG: hypothetical protein A2W33_07720 [Chloroflexi bacterium RBG_16_52_11]|nr:MAG: hypothetical protein A2W33_07720 [Chloroflexi bacterium RBG_16_52_11]